MAASKLSRDKRIGKAAGYLSTLQLYSKYFNNLLYMFGILQTTWGLQLSAPFGTVEGSSWVNQGVNLVVKSMTTTANLGSYSR